MKAENYGEDPDDYIVKSLLSVNCIIDSVNGALLVKERTAKPINDAISLLAVNFQCDRCMPKLDTHLVLSSFLR